MIDCWHTQLRLVSEYFPDYQIRGLRMKQVPYRNERFVYVTPTVNHRTVRIPPDVVEWAREQGYTMIHVQEPRE